MNIEPDPEDDKVVQLGARSNPPADAPAERWAFSSRTIQRLAVAGIMFWVSKQDFAPYVDQQLAADTVAMIADGLSAAFAVLGTVYMGAAARARQLGAEKPPERIYWLPRVRAA